MIDALLSFVQLDMWELLVLATVMFIAGFVRGFTGFALSALAMVIAGPVFGPIFLIPILYWQELSASIVLARAGWNHADRMMSFLLVVGSGAALPLGLWMTQSMSKDMSAIVALCAIMTLAVLALAKVRFSFLDNRIGTFVAGMVSGIVTGLSGAGGMVVALYVLSLNKDAKTIRGSLILYLLLSSVVSFIAYIAMGVMTWQSVQLAAVLIPFTLIGVFLGQRLFVPKYEIYYRPICLTLLVGLAAAGLINRAAVGS